MTNIERENIILELLEITTYPRSFFMGKSDNSLYVIYKQIKTNMAKYIKDIIEYEKKNNVENPYSEKELSQKKYNDLIEIRKYYGITKQNQEKPKKARDQKSSIDYQSQNIEPEIECQIITLDEARMMFGLDADIMDDEEYMKHGFRLEESSKTRRLTVEDVYLRREIIYIITQSGIIESEGLPYDEYNLELATFDTLRTLYENVRRIRPKTPTYEKLVKELTQK